jgi:hypothetical protein
MAVFELSRPGLRRCRIREVLPTEHPPILDQLGDIVDSLPDPAGLSGEQIIGSMTAIARVRNQIDAYLTHLAGAADVQRVAQTFRAGSTGTLVATATSSDPAAGSAMVATARALPAMPHVQHAYSRGLLAPRMWPRCATPPGTSPVSPTSNRHWSTWPPPSNPASCAGCSTC